MNGFNLSTYYYTDRKISILLYLLLTLAAISLTFYNYASHVAQDEEIQSSMASLSRLKSEVNLLKKDAEKYGKGRKSKGADAETGKIIKRIEGINALLERKGFSWSELLYSLELVFPKGVSITRIKPSYGDKKIRLSGVAKGIGNVTALVDNLDKSDYIKKSFLLSENTILIDNKYPAIAFEIESEGQF